MLGILDTVFSRFSRLVEYQGDDKSSRWGTLHDAMDFCRAKDGIPIIVFGKMDIMLGSYIDFDLSRLVPYILVR